MSPECSLMPGSILFPTEVSMYDTEKAFYRHYEYIQKENSLYSRWFQKRGLSYPQFLILDAVLRRPEGAEPTALAEECFMPKQTVTGLLDQLERAGFIRSAVMNSAPQSRMVPSLRYMMKHNTPIRSTIPRGTTNNGVSPSLP